MPNFNLMQDMNKSDACMISEQNPLNRKEFITCQRISSNSGNILSAILETMSRRMPNFELIW